MSAAASAVATLLCSARTRYHLPPEAAPLAALHQTRTAVSHYHHGDPPPERLKPWHHNTAEG